MELCNRFFRREKVPFDRALPEVIRAFGFEQLSAGDLCDLSEAYRLSMNLPAARARSEVYLRQYGSYDPLTTACLHILSRQAGLGWTTFKHTGAPVVTSAIGVGADRFGGIYSLADLAKKILPLLPQAEASPTTQPAAAAPAR